MAKILNRDYQQVKEYHFLCSHCGALSKFKRYDLSFYEDMDGIPVVSFSCPNCREETTFYEWKIDDKNLCKTRKNIISDKTLNVLYFIIGLVIGFIAYYFI